MAHKPEQNSQAIESDLERLELIYKRAASNTERDRALNRSVLERITSLIIDYRSEHMRLRDQEEATTVPMHGTNAQSAREGGASLGASLAESSSKQTTIDSLVTHDAKSVPKKENPPAKGNGTSNARRRVVG